VSKPGTLAFRIRLRPSSGWIWKESVLAARLKPSFCGKIVPGAFLNWIAISETRLGSLLPERR
jgi:hypothetical protein